MKRIILLSVFVITSVWAFSQDVIVTKDGKKISAIITEVDVNSLKYKNFENQSGPIYTVMKSDVASVMYQNGQIEVFQSPNESKNSRMANIALDPQKSKRLRTGGIAATAAGLAVLGSGIGLYFGSDQYYYSPYLNTSYWSYNDEMRISGIALMAAGSASTVAGIICWIVGQNRIKNSSGGFSLLETKKCRLDLNSSQSSVGLSLKF